MPEAAKWTVTYKARPGAEVEIWAVITGVPAEVTRAQLLEALELWQRWPTWQARMGPAGRINVRRGVGPGDGLPLPSVVLWASLAPESVRLGTELPGELHAQLVRAARRRDMSLAAFVRNAIALAVALADDEPLERLGVTNAE